MRNDSEVVVVGGGICGCMIAYLLSQTGIKVTVVERSGIGSQATGLNSGTLGPLLGVGIPGPLSDMGMNAFAIHMAVIEGLSADNDLGYRPLSRLHLASNEVELSRLKHIFDQYTSHEGFSASWLENREITEIEPRLNRKFITGVLTDGDRAVNGHRYTCTLATAALSAGATIVHGEVMGLRTRKDSVSAVIYSGGEIQCGSLVIAAGPWTPGIASMINYDVPIYPVKGEMLRLVYPPPAYDISYNGISCYRREGYRTWAGCTSDRDAGYDRSATDKARRTILNGAIDLFPDVLEKAIDYHAAALRAVTSDDLPVCGRIPGWNNAYVSAGGGFKGLLLSASMSRNVYDLITGETT